MQSQRETELEQMLDELKRKFHSLDKTDALRISILTIALEQWSIRKTAKEFGTTRHMARKAIELRKIEGVLALPTIKKGKPLPIDTVKKVVDFYESDVNSKVMSNQSSTLVKFTEAGCEKAVPKRLLLILKS